MKIFMSESTNECLQYYLSISYSEFFLFYKPNAYNICMVHERSSVHIYIASCRLLVLLCNFIQQFNLINLGFSPDGSGAEFIFYHIKSYCELCRYCAMSAQPIQQLQCHQTLTGQL